MSGRKVPKWYQDYPDWKRVLYTWRKRCCRTAMTVQCLSVLVGRDGKEVLKELKADPKVYVQFCEEVNAPVWGLNISELGATRESPEHLVRLSYWSLNYFPAPEWKGLYNMGGVKTFAEINPSDLTWLKKAAAGTYYPDED